MIVGDLAEDGGELTLCQRSLKFHRDRQNEAVIPVKARDVMLELVPTSEARSIKARIMPRDIYISRMQLEDFVRMSFSAYDPAEYGSVDGRVIRISSDAVEDERGSGMRYYFVDVGSRASWCSIQAMW